MNIVETLVLFNTAKLAKEKGFNEKCPSAYVYRNEFHERNDYKGILIHSNILLCDIKAPTKSLLQKWLRDKHDIDITIHRSFSMENSYHYCVIKNCDYENEIQQECIPNRTYEQALEEGLIEALKLI